TLTMQMFTNSAAFDPVHAAQNLMSGKGLLLLLDGLDEVPASHSQMAVDGILALSQYLSTKSPRSTLLITSRTQHFLALRNRQLEERFELLSIRPFTTADIYRFLMRWPFVAERRAQIVRIFNRIQRFPSLAEMCSNPLALAMFVARDQQTEGAEPPET